MRSFFLTSDTTDILYKFQHEKVSIKYQSYPKSRKINAFGQEIMLCLNPGHNIHIYFINMKSFFVKKGRLN